MKILLIAVALLIAIETEAYPGWSGYPGFQNGRGNNPGQGWGHQQRIEQQNNIEWVCKNPRTNDIMIIASDETRHIPQHNQESWWQWQNVPPGHQWQHHQQGNQWNKPIIIIQETPNTDTNHISSPLPTTEIPNNNNEQTNSPPYHGGEGIIDIRAGPTE
ncbi:PREDICTED: uncharacterized protein LOC108772777 [Cyphomyrmex costatus]|uniref:Uncharacterized protein n=1 Tax=Cyphomyrmex costatus TaxID=456900 RepID=A0A195CTR8_9HYME|nr:PREDICTED: uncharacterized protein LOC108772777 [Cyphomyrmex costatus]KYN04088.1 hypothetical protein ALC62_04852 [Cyphomyrmex costatus]